LIGALVDCAVAVPDFNLNAVVRNAGEDFDEVRAFVFADAVANGVLD